MRYGKDAFLRLWMTWSGAHGCATDTPPCQHVRNCRKTSCVPFLGVASWGKTVQQLSKPFLKDTMQQVWSIANMLKIKPFCFLKVWGSKKSNLKNLDEYAKTPTVFKSFKNIFVHFSRPYHMGENCCSNYQGFWLWTYWSIQGKKNGNNDEIWKWCVFTLVGDLKWRSWVRGRYASIPTCLKL